MAFRQIDHTGDIGIVVDAATREELFVEAVRAMTDVMTDLDEVAGRLSRSVKLEAAALDLLFVDWLSEALYLFETENLLAAGAQVCIEEAAGTFSLHGVLEGERHDPARHPHRVAIKAVTYHGLAIEASKGGWRARVIFDV